MADHVFDNSQAAKFVSLVSRGKTFLQLNSNTQQQVVDGGAVLIYAPYSQNICPSGANYY